MAWLFAADIGAQRARLADDEVRHVSRVLRRRPGDRLQLVDGAGRRAEGRWDGADGVEVERVEQWRAPTRRLVLALGARETVEEGVRRAAEIGVAEIVPVFAARSRDAGARPERWPAQVERLTAIMRSGCAQSGNPWLPGLAAPTAWDEARRTLDPETLVVLSGEAAAGLLDLEPAPTVVAVGPEGGWTDDEIAGCRTATLGPTVLRAPVAVAVALGGLRMKEASPCAA